MKPQFLTRYSFFGKSDWRSNASQDPERLLAPSRLEQREALFEKIALRSLQDQTDPDFELIVLSSAMMPEAYKKRLSELCRDMLGERAHVIFREPRRVASAFNRFRASIQPEGAGHTIQTILDDDDGVSKHFVRQLKAEAQTAVNSFRSQQDYVFISHASGLNLKLSSNGDAEISKRNIACTAQGLTLVAPAGSNRSPFNIAHKKILERRPVRVLHGGPAMYVRTVHNLNDSRGMVGNDVIGQEEVAEISKSDLPLLGQFVPLLQDALETA